MAKATWKNIVLAESDQTIMVEGNHYFPPESVNMDLFSESTYHTVCPWKGKADYFTVTVDGEVNENAAWTYPEPKDAAKNIKDYVAFWRGVAVEG